MYDLQDKSEIASKTSDVNSMITNSDGAGVDGDSGSQDCRLPLVNDFVKLFKTFDRNFGEINSTDNYSIAFHESRLLLLTQCLDQLYFDYSQFIDVEKMDNVKCYTKYG